MPKTSLSQWSEIRGFNYQPGYSPHLQYTWTNFDLAAWEKEVPWALRFGTNTLRVWLDWSAFLVLGDTFFTYLDQALDVLDKHQLRMVPVLFNRWNDPRYPAGGISDADLRSGGLAFDKFHPYVDGLMARFGNDPRIILWDLANEPQAPGPTADVALQEVRWLGTVADRVRRGSTIPLTIGTMMDDNVAHFAAMVDVISFHPYPRGIGEIDEMTDRHLRLAAVYDRPLLCTETCVGSFDDKERGGLARDCIEALERYQVGWLAWQLCGGRFVTGSRERTDSNAVRPGEGYMPFVLESGATRPGHEWLVKRNTKRDVGAQTISLVRSPLTKPKD